MKSRVLRDLKKYFKKTVDAITQNLYDIVLV